MSDDEWRWMNNALINNNEWIEILYIRSRYVSINVMWERGGESGRNRFTRRKIYQNDI